MLVAVAAVPFTPVAATARPAEGGSGCCPELRKRTALPLASDLMSTFVTIVSAMKIAFVAGLCFVSGGDADTLRRVSKQEPGTEWRLQHCGCARCDVIGDGAVLLRRAKSFFKLFM